MKLKDRDKNKTITFGLTNNCSQIDPERSAKALYAKEFTQIKNKWHILRQIFHKKDEFDSGCLSCIDFKRVIRLAGVKFREEDVALMSNNQGGVNYKEFYIRFIRDLGH